MLATRTGVLCLRPPAAAKLQRHNAPYTGRTGLVVRAIRDQRDCPTHQPSRPQQQFRGSPEPAATRGRERERVSRQLADQLSGGATQLSDSMLESLDAASARALRLLREAQVKWSRVEDKTSVTVAAGAVFMFLYLGGAVVDRLDRLPLVGTFLELVGLLVVGVNAYKWYASPQERALMRSDLKALARKIGIDLDL